MPKVNPEYESFARIKVVGVGGSGGNAINHMVDAKVDRVEFIAINTDAQDIHRNKANRKIHIGKNLTKGLGAGMDPEKGKRAAEETQQEIQEALRNADMVFVTCGMGGGTGTGAAPVVARMAREQGALTIGVVTKPFAFEGTQRGMIAEKGLETLESNVDAVIIIPNDKLFQLSNEKLTMLNAFGQANEVLRQAVEGISDLITNPGLINLDFADVRRIMQGAGTALMGIGVASGENRAMDAAKIAISSPLLDVTINGARGVLIGISGGEDITMDEIQQATSVITESVDANATIIFGVSIDEKLKKGELKITVIATGFPDAGRKVRSVLLRGEARSTANTTPAQTETYAREAVVAHREPTPVATVIRQAPPAEPAYAAEDDYEDEEDDALWGSAAAPLAAPVNLRKEEPAMQTPVPQQRGIYNSSFASRDEDEDDDSGLPGVFDFMKRKR
jgi:cell division protein FtsZ